jgi:hypothetical protein
MKRTILLLSVLAGAAAAQIHVYGHNESPAFHANETMGGPIVAIKFVSPIADAITRVEVFTGITSGVNRIGLWTHNPTLDQPGQVIQDATWSMATANSWQGVNLGGVPLAMGTTYWVVWTPIAGAQASTDINGPQQNQIKCSFDGGMSWHGPYNERWKFRLFAGRSILVMGMPFPGASVPLQIGFNRDPLHSYVMAASFTSTPGIPLAPDGRPIPLTPDAMMLLSLSTPSIFQNFSGVLDGLGNATATLNLPNLPALSGFQFKMAAVSLEAVSSSGVKSITDPLNFQIL